MPKIDAIIGRVVMWVILAVGSGSLVYVICRAIWYYANEWGA